jgi:hypothetical protein
MDAKVRSALFFLSFVSFVCEAVVVVAWQGWAQVRTLGHMAAVRMRTLSDEHGDVDTSLLAHDNRRRHHEPQLLH